MLKCSLKRLTAEALTVFSAAVVLFGCAAQPVKGYVPWRTFAFNYERGNVSPDKIQPPLVLAWARDLSAIRFFKPIPEEQLSSPALSDGILYVGSTNRSFYTYDLYSGKLLWRFDAENPLEAAPAVTGDLVCFGSGGGVLRCLDKKSGAERWSFQAKSEIMSSPIIEGDRLYISSSDDRFYALSLKNGEKIWSYYRSPYQTVTPRLTSSPAYFDNKIYDLFSDGVLVCLKADTGKELWSRKVVKNFDSSDKTRRTPLALNGMVYMIDGSNEILALDAVTGELKDTYNIIKAYDFVFRDKRTLVVAGSDQVVALDTVNGSILWKTKLRHRPSSIFAAGDYLFVLTNYSSAPFNIGFLSKTKGYIQALRLKDGAEAWGGDLGYSLTANASASEGHVALLTNEGALEVFSVK